eukprot:2293032-Rhodomonas_salina.1
MSTPLQHDAADEQGDGEEYDEVPDPEQSSMSPIARELQDEELSPDSEQQTTLESSSGTVDGDQNTINRTRTPHFYTEFAARTLGRDGVAVPVGTFEGTPSAGDESFMQAVEEEVDRDEAETESELLRFEESLSSSNQPSSQTSPVALADGSGSRTRKARQGRRQPNTRSSNVVGSPGFLWIPTDLVIQTASDELPVEIIEEEILNHALAWLPPGDVTVNSDADAAEDMQSADAAAENDFFPLDRVNTPLEQSGVEESLGQTGSPSLESTGHSPGPGFVTEYMQDGRRAVGGPTEMARVDGDAEVETLEDGSEFAGTRAVFEVEVAGSREEGITLMRDLYTILDDEGFESVAALTYLLDQPLEQRLALYRLPLPLRSSDAEEEEEEDENAVSEEEEEAAQLVRAWLEEGGAMCVQRAIRMHLARRRLRVQDERRTANQAGDFRSESKRFIEELMRAEDDDDVADLVSHGLTLLLVLPMEERAYIASVLAESDAAGARAVRAAGVGVIQRAVRGHQARAVVRRRKLEREAGRVEDSAEAVKDVQRGDAEKEGEVQGDESAEGKDEESEDKRMGQLIQEGMELLSALPPADVENLDAMLAAVSVRDEDDGGGDASLEYAAAMSKLTGLTERVRALWEELGEEAAVAQVMRLGAEMEEEQATILQKMVDLVVGSSEGVQPGFGTATLASLGATAEAAAADVQPLRETTDGIAHGKEAAGAEAAHQTAEKERA